MTDTLTFYIGKLFMFLGVLVVTVIILSVVGFLLVLWIRWKDREKKSLKMINLLLSLPEDNEVKVDAMEQVISSLSNMYEKKKPKFLQFSN